MRNLTHVLEILGVSSEPETGDVVRGLPSAASHVAVLARFRVAAILDQIKGIQNIDALMSVLDLVLYDGLVDHDADNVRAGVYRRIFQLGEHDKLLPYIEDGRIVPSNDTSMWDYLEYVQSGSFLYMLVKRCAFVGTIVSTLRYILDEDILDEVANSTAADFPCLLASEVKKFDGVIAAARVYRGALGKRSLVVHSRDSLVFPGQMQGSVAVNVEEEEVENRFLVAIHTGTHEVHISWGSTLRGSEFRGHEGHFRGLLAEVGSDSFLWGMTSGGHIVLRREVDDSVTAVFCKSSNNFGTFNGRLLGLFEEHITSALKESVSVDNLQVVFEPGYN